MVILLPYFPQYFLLYGGRQSGHGSGGGLVEEGIKGRGGGEPALRGVVGVLGGYHTVVIASKLNTLAGKNLKFCVIS